MPRPSIPSPKDVIAIAKGLKSEGIDEGSIKLADGTEIKWGQSTKHSQADSQLQKWKDQRNAAS